MSRFLLLAIFFVASAVMPTPGLAEYGCQTGFVPVYQGTRQVCVADYNLPSWKNAPQRPQVAWVSRWGAIAVDADLAMVGVSSSYQAEQSAKDAAIADCMKRGGKSCVVQSSYSNQCVSLATGPGVYAFEYSKKKEKAISAALRACKRKAASQCVTIYSECNYPVKVTR